MATEVEGRRESDEALGLVAAGFKDGGRCAAGIEGSGGAMRESEGIECVWRRCTRMRRSDGDRGRCGLGLGGRLGLGLLGLRGWMALGWLEGAGWRL